MHRPKRRFRDSWLNKDCRIVVAALKIATQLPNARRPVLAQMTFHVLVFTKGHQQSLERPAERRRMIKAITSMRSNIADGAEPLEATTTPLEQLLRRFRVSDSPDRFQRDATESLRDDLGISVVAWVPSSPRESVIASGKIESPSIESYRTLAVGGARPAGLDLAVAPAGGESPAGWLIAIEPLTGIPFPADIDAKLAPVAALIASHRANARTYADLKDLLFGVVRALTAAIDAKDPYTSGHSERVARIAVRLGEELGLSPHRRGDLYLMGLLHDVGKIGIEDGVLKKTGPLTDSEFRLIQSHVEIGVNILADLKKLHHLLPGVRFHHESLDGSGYPSGLVGEEIPLEARILAVADAFDAMSSTRPYRRRLSPADVDARFREGSGRQWDPRVVDALFACRADLDRIRQKGLGESLNRVVDETLGRF
jgi:HD-GYP domain-containing protein (c-di-GMP phosphodiesterase class II)